MVRMQIQLEPDRHRLLKRRAKRLGVSVSELIRRYVDAQLREEDDGSDTRARRLMAVAGKYRDPAGVTDVAARHDEALAAAYAQPPRAARTR